jgi:hypothetical protein
MKFISLIIILNITLAVKASVPSYVPTNGLVGWWPFNGNANDESGNGNNGTVNGVTLTQDRNGNSNSAFSFDGINDFIGLNLLSTLNNQTYATFSFWVNFTQQDGCIIGHWASNFGNINQNLGAVIERSGSSSILFSNNGGLGANLTQAIGNNTWYHIVFVLDGSQSSSQNRLLLYINGQLSTINYGIVNDKVGTATSTFFGRRDVDFGNYGNYFGGMLDDIGIWNRALTQQEITNLYNASVPSTSCPALPSNLQSGLVGYWPFCGNANDESGNGNNYINNNVNYVVDRFGVANGALSFMAINNSSLINQVFPVTSPNNFTYSFWIEPGNTHALPSEGATNNGSGGILTNECVIHPSHGECYGNSSTSAGTGVFVGKNGVIVAEHSAGFVKASLVSSISILGWHHVVVVYMNKVPFLYIDGNFVKAGLSDYRNVYLSIGKDLSYYYPNSGIGTSFDYYHLTGKLDDLIIWNRALSASEVNQVYNSQLVSPSGGSGSLNVNAIAFPSGISYQAVARDSTGLPLANSSLEVRFTLRDSSISGTAFYAETHAVTTNSLGLFNSVIGSGVPSIGTYAAINWMDAQKFLSVEINTGNGFQLIGNQQLLSVPYANAAKTATQLYNTNLPVYNDNTAALAGGLQAGQLYRTSTGDLKIVY